MGILNDAPWEPPADFLEVYARNWPLNQIENGTRLFLFNGSAPASLFTSNGIPDIPPSPEEFEYLHLQYTDYEIGGSAVGEVTYISLSIVTVGLDIKPGNDHNNINPNSKKRIAVAILGSIDFDATQIVDFTTVTFGPGGASPVHDGHVEDVNGDGYMDMVFHFKTLETGIVCGDIEATLTGNTFGGIQFTGTDTVKTVGCK
jgi:hypothetical protein